MATAVAAAILTKTYQMRRGTSGGFQAGDLATVRATEAGHVEFASTNPCKPELYTGPITHPDEVQQLDLTPAADFSDRPIVTLTNADLRQWFGWTDARIELAIGELKMPAGEVEYEFDARDLTGSPSGARRVWKSNGQNCPIDRYHAILVRMDILPAKR
jgi:hypothetical protein